VSIWKSQRPILRRTVILEYVGGDRKVIVEAQHPTRDAHPIRFESPTCSKSEEWLVRESRKECAEKLKRASGLTADRNRISYLENAAA
jgi:hypothetical protein